MTKDPDPDLLLPGEAAKYLGVTVRTLRRYRHDNKITPDRVLPSGHARFSVKTLDEFLEAAS